MNINGIASNNVKPQLPITAPKPTAPVATGLRVDSETTAKEARAKAFYTREEEPWKGKFYIYGDDFTKPERCPMTKEVYIRHLEMGASIDLTLQQSYYDSFRKELIDLRPDLANKGFSYTLGDDAKIKIIAPENSLKDDEVKWLTNVLNNIEDFKESVLSHARIMMELVDHDTEKFGGKYSLNLMNFQNTIDYGKVVAIRKNDLSEEWIRQIHQNAEKRESSLVDIRA